MCTQHASQSIFQEGSIWKLHAFLCDFFHEAQQLWFLHHENRKYWWLQKPKLCEPIRGSLGKDWAACCLCWGLCWRCGSLLLNLARGSLVTPAAPLPEPFFFAVADLSPTPEEEGCKKHASGRRIIFSPFSMSHLKTLSSENRPFQWYGIHVCTCTNSCIYFIYWKWNYGRLTVLNYCCSLPLRSFRASIP